MNEPMIPVLFKSDRELIERADRLAKAKPEYEGNRSRVIRTALREHLDREEASAKQKAEVAA